MNRIFFIRLLRFNCTCSIFYMFVMYLYLSVIICVESVIRVLNEIDVVDFIFIFFCLR